jgi:hypothetical protein
MSAIDSPHKIVPIGVIFRQKFGSQIHETNVEFDLDPDFQNFLVNTQKFKYCLD